jgi:hypothetical protein
MPKLGHINATWTHAAREMIEQFVNSSNISGAVLTLSKKDDGPNGSRWLYTVYSGERIKPMRAAMEARGHALLHSLDGLTVAISSLHNLHELDGAVIDLDGPGYLLVRAPAGPPASR